MTWINRIFAWLNVTAVALLSARQSRKFRARSTCSFGPRKDRKIMKLALYGLVTAALLALGSGCATYCGPVGARPGSGCDTGFAESIWSDSCDTTCTGSTGPKHGGGCRSPLDTLFGGGAHTGGCTSSYYDGEPAASGPAVAGPAVGRPAVGGPAIGGFTCLGCNDPSCGGGCLGAGAVAALAAQPVRRAVGHVGQAVAAMPQNMQNRCANGLCGQVMGPTQGSVQYPYYTTRGPRDFFLANPPSIGP